jgi:phosphoribosylformylglycinamidine (FGAM) synthase-like amidotransferase family enzyme
VKSAVIVFPGSNCDRDMEVALREVGGQAFRLQGCGAHRREQ